jgi:hypothetical protein
VLEMVKFCVEIHANQEEMSFNCAAVFYTWGSVGKCGNVWRMVFEIFDHVISCDLDVPGLFD